MKRGNTNQNKFNNFLKKFWQIVWKDESFKGWIISLIFIFIVIKLILFPLLNLVTGTALPLAIVESCSMYHSDNILGNFDNWWNRHYSKYELLGIEKTEFEDFSFKKGFSKGDILFIMAKKPEKLEIGDIIVFNANQQNPIIHRIIDIKQEDEEYIFSTMGDNNNGQISFEKNIRENQIVGKAVFRIAPSLGWIKLIFYEHLKSQSDKGFCEER